MSSAPAFRRTQIYLTADEQAALDRLARRSARTRSDLIREAIDAYVVEVSGASRAERLAAGRGLWAGRNDLPDFAVLRHEWDRPRPSRPGR